ncbi:ATP-binding cassette domain-containing protein (plasmid) [Clostridium botulinum]|uniref:Methionine import ATP-binding protein MetN n=1 Tax=Clostridium botulinum (strain 657 / Type Ba4) TaxID=515621 RepID=A0A3F2ZTS7_CLOB6|nr:ATP-binding cassette domain-containing protein [Clostridium botulinum]ACQ51245.1 methionine import ATP-binding protein MetN [Clostridium botulinum Ba4 str. 657]AXG90363.1 ATP-binding cassette domain-containing protein [Clostridium botulinum]
MIELTNVSKKIKDIEILRNINCKINNKFVYVIGKSGSGKTTLINLLANTDIPSEGNIIVNDKNIADTKFSKHQKVMYKRSTGVIYQDYKLINDMTVYENVALALRVQRYPLHKIHKKTIEALEELNMNEFKDNKPCELSGGEQQRVGIARAIVKSPQLILADEPTSNLDIDNSIEVIKILEDIHKKHKIPIIMATHNDFLVNKFKHRVIKLEKGSIIYDRERGTYFV